MQSSGIIVVLVGLFHAGAAQLIFASDDPLPSVTKCNEHQPFILPARVTNLERHDWTKMVVVWKYEDNTELYFHNGEAVGRPENPRINDAFKVQKLKEEDVEMGDLSLTLSKAPPAGRYSCEVIELSREGKKTLKVYHKSDPDCSSPKEVTGAGEITPKQIPNTDYAILCNLVQKERVGYSNCGRNLENIKDLLEIEKSYLEIEKLKLEIEALKKGQK